MELYHEFSVYGGYTTTVYLKRNMAGGEARINSSIGSQWGNGKAKFLEMQIRESIKSIDLKDYTTTFLNVKLATE